MSKYVVSVYGTVRVDVVVDAESEEELNEAAQSLSDAFEEHGETMFDLERDYLPEQVDLDIMTLEDSKEIDGIGEDACMTLAECMSLVPGE